MIVTFRCARGERPPPRAEVVKNSRVSSRQLLARSSSPFSLNAARIKCAGWVSRIGRGRARLAFILGETFARRTPGRARIFRHWE